MIIKSQINDQLSHKSDHQRHLSPQIVDNFTKTDPKWDCEYYGQKNDHESQENDHEITNKWSSMP